MLLASICLYLLLDVSAPSPSPPPAPVPNLLPATIEQAHDEGMRLNDQGDYAGALRAYRRGLQLEPGNETLLYEVALTLCAQGDLEQCRQRAAEGAARTGQVRPRYYALLGNSLDGLGRNAEAIAAFEQGLALTPDHPELLYNLAVALSIKGDWRAARAHLKHDLELRPDHVGAHLLLVQGYDADHLRVPALLAALRVLALEGDTPRAESLARHLEQLLDQGVSRGEKGVAVVIDADASKDEGDFSGVEAAVSLVAALRFTGRLSARDVRTHQVGVLLETIKPETVDGFLQRHYVAFLAEAKQRELLATLVSGAWPEGNAPSAAQRRALTDWARSFKPAAPAPRP